MNPRDSRRSERMYTIEDEDVTEDMDDESITSEEEAGSGSDSEQRVKARPIQDIWEDGIIKMGLEALPGAEEISILLQKEDTESVLAHKDGFRTGVLLASWMGNYKALKSLLDNGANPQVLDDGGRSALHLAAYNGQASCVKILLEAGAVAGGWDTMRKATPLHCAASKGSLQSLRLLLSAGADVNAGLAGRSALHYAVQSDATDCVKELLEAGATPNTPQVFTETPLHVAAAMGFADCIRLLLKHGAEVKMKYGPGKTTALHLAAEDGNVECVRLLLDGGAVPNATNHKLQTPLHLAALAQSTETIEILLNRGANPNLGDADGRTTLHAAIVKVSRSCECVKLLLNAGADVNRPDAYGYTPLHTAALNEFSHCVLMLINYGGDVTARTNGGVSVLSFIVRRTPEVLPKYIEKLDSSIKLNDHEIGDVDCELKLDFRILVPCVGRGETELLLNFIEVGQREILKHPLCETFLFLKWRRIRKFFLFSLFYHSIFVVLLTSYILGVFLKDCPHKRKVQDCKPPVYIEGVGFTIVIFNTVLLTKEIFQIAHNWRSYVRQWENWLQWSVIISVYLSVVPNSIVNIHRDVTSWQHHVAAFGIFLTWLELMMIVGRFPIFGLYVQMFTTVAINFSKFFLAYSCLFIAFGLSFGVLFTNYKSFKTIILSLLKIIIMMSGELEFEDIFYPDEHEQLTRYPGTAHILFLGFVILVTVILTNLMVGLAVSDIQGLQQSAGLDRLVRQAELVAHLESMLFSRLLRCVPKRILKFCHNKALLLTSQYHWALYIRPNDPREERVPRDLIKDIYRLVAEHKERPKNNGHKKSYKQSKSNGYIDSGFKKTNYMKSPPLSRISSLSSNIQDVNALKTQVKELRAEILRYQQSMQRKLSQIAHQIGNKQ